MWGGGGGGGGGDVHVRVILVLVPGVDVICDVSILYHRHPRLRSTNTVNESMNATASQ